MELEKWTTCIYTQKTINNLGKTVEQHKALENRTDGNNVLKVFRARRKSG